MGIKGHAVGAGGDADGSPPGAGAAHGPRAGDRPLFRLSRAQIVLCLAVPIGIFLFGWGPIWEHPWDIDRAIWWSYVPLPFLVLGCLAWSRRLTLRDFFLDALSLTLAKYSVTFTIALVLWSTGGPPPPADARGASGPAAPAESPPAPTPIPPGSAGAVRGVVADASGRPVAGALVFLDKGLEGYVFAPPAEPLLLDNGPTGVTPRLSAAQTWQTISARSSDGQLHTLVAASAGGPLFHVPLLSTGARSQVVVREPHGVTKIRCAVHQGDREAKSYLAVFAHPFFAITGEGGRFAWTGVPAGQLRVAAFHPELGEGAAPAELAPGGEADVQLGLATTP
jgi:hypothetical protein